METAVALKLVELVAIHGPEAIKLAIRALNKPITIEAIEELKSLVKQPEGY
ncbi:MAG: hypothetical protein ACNI27_08510 [Desulfovibrio sp.]